MPIVKHYFCLLSFFLLLILSTVMAGLDPAITCRGDDGGGRAAGLSGRQKITGSSPVTTTVEGARSQPSAMAGHDPAIPSAGGAASGHGSGMDHRVAPGDDGGGGAAR